MTQKILQEYFLRHESYFKWIEKYFLEKRYPQKLIIISMNLQQRSRRQAALTLELQRFPGDGGFRFRAKTNPFILYVISHALRRSQLESHIRLL